MQIIIITVVLSAQRDHINPLFWLLYMYTISLTMIYVNHFPTGQQLIDSITNESIFTVERSVAAPASLPDYRYIFVKRSDIFGPPSIRRTATLIAEMQRAIKRRITSFLHWPRSVHVPCLKIKCILALTRGCRNNLNNKGVDKDKKTYAGLMTNGIVIKNFSTIASHGSYN